MPDHAFNVARTVVIEHKMNKTVLVIDDDDMLRKSLATGLRAADFECITAASAEDAAAILARVRVDAIVLDRMMAGMDGLTFLRQIRATSNVTPVIMLTAMSGPDNAIDGLAAGADDYLAKPFRIQELVLRIRNIMRTRGDRPQMPAGLIFADGEFFVDTPAGPCILGLSGEEKKLLVGLTSPVGNIVAASPMVAKRLRAKLNGVLSQTDIITVRGHGYKLVSGHTTQPQENAE